MRRYTLLAIMAALSATPAFAAELTVQVNGISSATGEIGCAVHVDATTFPMGKPLQQVCAPAAPAGATCRFPSLPAGTYAVSVVHGLNGNRKTDANLIGMPIEPWGVSNDVRPRLRAPRFDEARITVPAEGATISVRMAR